MALTDGLVSYWRLEEVSGTRIDEVALWSRVLSGSERTELYNGGTGLAYSDLGGSSYDWAPIYRLASMKRRKRRLTSH